MSIFDDIINIDYNAGKASMEGLSNGTLPLYLFDLYKKTNKGLFVVTNTLYEANKLYSAISNYTKDVLLFPMDDFLTTQIATISPELKSVRLSTINELIKDNNKIVVTHLMGHLKFLPPKEKSIKNIIEIKKGDSFNRDELLETLDSIGYNRSIIVTATGEFAVRGFIIDIFPINQTEPIRIEFFGDEIDSIRTFNEETQLSKKELNKIEIHPFSETNTNSNESSLLDYMNEPILTFIDYNQIQNGYKNLVSEMFEYNERNNSDLTYMHDFYELKSSDELYIMLTDNILTDINLNKQLKLISSNIPSFNGNIEQIKEFIYSKVDSNKTVIVLFDTEKQIKNFKESLSNIETLLENEDLESLKESLRVSTERRKAFDKK